MSANESANFTSPSNNPDFELAVWYQWFPNEAHRYNIAMFKKSKKCLGSQHNSKLLKNLMRLLTFPVTSSVSDLFAFGVNWPFCAKVLPL